jgi:hypothetical protein
VPDNGHGTTADLTVNDPDSARDGAGPLIDTNGDGRARQARHQRGMTVRAARAAHSLDCGGGVEYRRRVRDILHPAAIASGAATLCTLPGAILLIPARTRNFGVGFFIGMGVGGTLFMVTCGIGTNL